MSEAKRLRMLEDENRKLKKTTAARYPIHIGSFGLGVRPVANTTALWDCWTRETDYSLEARAKTHKDPPAGTDVSRMSPENRL